MSSNLATYTKHERLWIKDRPEFSERWVQEIIAQDPTILGLEDVVLRDMERVHRGAGRLDLLLQDRESNRRYEVELQLGATDESHIIRTIEYWDIERKRYPQYDHCAVIVAEDITSRFLNVISLFNGSIPIIAIQMQLIRVADKTTLVFTTVLNELQRGLVDDDEPQTVPADRAYWESSANKDTLALADGLLDVVHRVDPGLNLHFTKFYIGLAKDKQPFNFLWLEPRKRKNSSVLNLKLASSEYTDTRVQATGLETLDHAYGSYRIRLTAADLSEKSDALQELIELAYKQKQQR